MVKIATFLLTFFLFVNSSFCQLTGISPKIIDDHGKLPVNLQSAKRSAQAPTQCGMDTIEYPYYKASGFNFITINKGRGLGQLYSAPKPITVSGFSFYAIVATNPPTQKTIRLICNLYKAGADSLPKGFPLRSDTVTIDTNFYKGLLSKLVKHCKFKTPIKMDSAYIITIESDSVSVNAYGLVNSFANADGDKENLNCGSISGAWYNGKNLNVNGVPFNCDVMLHPHVTYTLGTDFTIKNPCYNLMDTVKFTNLGMKGIAGAKMYNRYAFYGIPVYSHLWNTSDGFGYVYAGDHKVKYAQKQNYKIQLITTVYGYKGVMQQGCADTAVKWLYYKPDFPSVNGPVNVCIGDTAVYKINNVDTGSIYQWYRKATDATPFLTGKVYTRFPLVKTDTFYVRGNNHNCVTGLREVIMNVNSYPATLTIKNDSICSGSKANLKGFTNVGSIEWFESNTSPAILFTGNVFQTPVLTKDTFFYVRANNKGCIKSPRVKVNAFVGSNFAPAPPTITPDTTICMATTSILILNASAPGGLTIRWFDAGSGSSNIATGNNYAFIPTIREVRTYYADAYNGVCGSTRIPVAITVEDFPKISKKFSDTICLSDSLIVSVNIPFGEADWYDAATGGNLLYTGTRYASQALFTASYFVETRSGICKSTSRTVLNGLVNTFPLVTKLWGDTICAKHKATLKSKFTGPGTIHWFEYDTSTVELGKGKIYQTFVLNGSKTFYGQPEYAGCYGPKQILAPLVRPIPFPGFSYEIFSNSQNVKVSPLNAVGSTILWSFGDGGTSTQGTVTHWYANPGTYVVKLTLTGSNGCKDTMVNTVNIGASGIQGIGTLPSLKLYPNPTQSELNIELEQMDGNVLVAIYSVTGSLIAEENKTVEGNRVRFDLNHLSAGLYLLKINGYQAVMFIKE